jgi:hypothetical protein
LSEAPGRLPSPVIPALVLRHAYHTTHTHNTHTMRGAMYSGAVLAALLASASASEEDLSSPMIRTAMEFLGRASTTSNVLTLNLTNLLILLILKAIIIGFGIFAAGGGSLGGGLGGNIGRSADGEDKRIVSQSDMTGGMCFLMYTSGAEEKMACVQRTACEDPYLATDYVTAAKMWYKMHKLMSS